MDELIYFRVGGRTYLTIEVERGKSDVVAKSLAAFPFEPGQCFSHVEDDGDGQYVMVDMGNHADTSVAQEEFLNRQDGVISYWVM